MAVSRSDYARAFVARGGYDPDSPSGTRRVNAVIVAAEVCATYQQFTRAAYFALEPGFGRQLSAVA